MSRGFYFYIPISTHTRPVKNNSMGIKKLFGIYFGGYREPPNRNARDSQNSSIK